MKSSSALCFVLFSLLLPNSAEALKFLGYVPIFGHSHTSTIGRVGEILAEAGHEVVILHPILDTSLPNKTSVLAKVIWVQRSPKLGEYQDDEHMRNLWLSSDKDPRRLINTIRRTAYSMATQCETTIQEPGLIDWIREQKFDAAFSEAVDQCAFVIFHLAGIKKYATVSAYVTTDGDFLVTGRPDFPSYVPTSISRHTDSMNFWERMENAFTLMVIKYFRYIIKEEFDAFAARVLPDMPPIQELWNNASLVFNSAEQLVEFPRITTQKMISFGGAILDVDNVKPLEDKWHKICALRPHTMMIAFGSVTKSVVMPQSYKEGILGAMRRLPNVTFIWKYEEPDDEIGKDVKNLVKVAWLPQKDLLFSGKISAFLGHGGSGTTMESLYSGLPVIVVPVMGDQFRQARLIERIGMGKYIEKSGLANEDLLVDYFSQVLFTDTYRDKAKFIARMLREQPQSPRERVLSNLVFLAKFGPLNQLHHASRDLPWYELYLVDVILFVSLLALSVFLVLITITYQLIKCCLCRFTKPTDARKKNN